MAKFDTFFLLKLPLQIIDFLPTKESFSLLTELFYLLSFLIRGVAYSNFYLIYRRGEVKN